MRQLAGTKTRYRRAYAAPLAGLISDRAEYKGIGNFLQDRSDESHLSLHNVDDLYNRPHIPTGSPP